MLFARSKSLDPNDAAAAMIRGELQLIGVREPGKVAEAGLKGAQQIPLGLTSKLDEIGRDRPIVAWGRPGLTVSPRATGGAR